MRARAMNRAMELLCAELRFAEWPPVTMEPLQAAAKSSGASAVAAALSEPELQPQSAPAPTYLKPSSVLSQVSPESETVPRMESEVRTAAAKTMENEQLMKQNAVKEAKQLEILRAREEAREKLRAQAARREAAKARSDEQLRKLNQKYAVQPSAAPAPPPMTLRQQREARKQEEAEEAKAMESLVAAANAAQVTLPPKARMVAVSFGLCCGLVCGTSGAAHRKHTLHSAHRSLRTSVAIHAHTRFAPSHSERLFSMLF
eukprot:SAG11_NODE_4282_length_1969_cov_1.565775_2_plen_259_part_00